MLLRRRACRSQTHHLDDVHIPCRTSCISAVVARNHGAMLTRSVSRRYRDPSLATASCAGNACGVPGGQSADRCTRWADRSTAPACAANLMDSNSRHTLSQVLESLSFHGSLSQAVGLHAIADSDRPRDSVPTVEPD